MACLDQLFSHQIVNMNISTSVDARREQLWTLRWWFCFSSLLTSLPTPTDAADTKDHCREKMPAKGCISAYFYVLGFLATYNDFQEDLQHHTKWQWLGKWCWQHLQWQWLTAVMPLATPLYFRYKVTMTREMVLATFTTTMTYGSHALGNPTLFSIQSSCSPFSRFPTQ